MRQTLNLLARESYDHRRCRCRYRRRCRCRCRRRWHCRRWHCRRCYRCHRRRHSLDALRTQSQLPRALSDFAGSFREWAREHRAEATKQAGRFVARLLRDKAANQSVGYTARLHVAAWKAY